MMPRKVSAAKSVSWRLIGVAMLGVITYVITLDLPKTTIVTALHHGAFIFIFYAHERFWEGRGVRGKPFIKAFSYEIVLGFIVLGIITFVVTGSWRQVTMVTTTYLTLRFIGYPIHERFYERCNRQR